MKWTMGAMKLWMTDPKYVRSLLIALVIDGCFLLIFVAVLYSVRVEWFILLAFLSLYVPITLIDTLQFLNYSKGIFVSDFEIILPGVIKKKFSAQELEKIVLSDRRSRMRNNYVATFFLKGKRFSHSVTFSSAEKRQEIVELICEFCPHVQITDRTKKRE